MQADQLGETRHMDENVFVFAGEKITICAVNDVNWGVMKAM